MQLVVLLMVVVVLVVVVLHLALRVVIHAARVVAPPIAALFRFRCIVPSHVGLLCTIEGDELHCGVVGEVACLQEIGIEVRRCTVHVTVATDVRQASLNTEVPVQQSRAKAQGLLVRTIRTTAGIQPYIWLHADAFSQHINACTKGTSTIRACSHTTLHLNGLHAAGKVANVGEVDERTLAVVKGNAIRRHIDARSVCATHPNACVTDAVACICCGGNAWQSGEQEGNVLPIVHSLNLLAVQVAMCHRRLACGAKRSHLHFLQICLFLNILCPGHTGACQHRHSQSNKTFHFFSFIIN